MTLRAEVRENWHSNRWMRRLPACLTLMLLWIVVQCWLSLGFAGFFGAAPIDAAYVACFVLAARTAAGLRTAREAAERRLARESAELRTPRVPDAGPDQCPVCGGYGLDALAKDDVFMERGERARVIPYGPRRAHWDCAAFVPYTPTHEDRQREKLEQWRREGRLAEGRDRRNFEDSWPVLMAPAEQGAREIRLDREAIPEYRHWMIAIGPITHNDILAIESCRRADDGYGWIAALAEPLRHTLRVDDVLSNKLMPLDSERMWNREAGRPYTRTELGLCDCGGHAIGGGVTMAQVSDVLRAMAQGY